MRYWLGPNTLGGMDWCPGHLSFDAGVPRSKMTIILLVHSLVLDGGIPVAPGSMLRNSTSHATDRQSLCLLSLNAQMNSSKAVVRVSIQPSLSLNTGVVYKSQPDILEMNSRTPVAMISWASVDLWFLLLANKQSSMNSSLISSRV